MIRNIEKSEYDVIIGRGNSKLGVGLLCTEMIIVCKFDDPSIIGSRDTGGSEEPPFRPLPVSDWQKKPGLNRVKLECHCSKPIKLQKFLMCSSISTGNSMICSDIWNKYLEWYFEIVRRKARFRRRSTHVPNLTEFGSTLERHWRDIWFRRRTVCRT